MPDQRDTGAPAPLNPMAAFTLVIAFPGRTFQRLKDDPHWVMPLLFVVLCSMVSGAYAVVGGHLNGFLENIALRTGQEPTLTRSAFLASTVVSSLIGVPLILLLESLFYKLSGMLRGGSARFAVVFSTVAYASVPIGLGALAIVGLMALTGSPTVGTNLSFLVDGTRHPVLWSIARQLDLFSIWFFILLGIAAEHVFDLPRRRGRQVGLLFAVFYLFIMSISGIGNAGQFENPYEHWATEEVAAPVTRQDFPGSPTEPSTGTVVAVHYGSELATNAAAAQLADAKSAVPLAADRAQSVLGLPPLERIDVYLYPSVEAKRAITDNAELAHAVEWASAVHVAWVYGAERAFVREAAKVSAAAAFGSMYNPCIRDGVGVAAAGSWGDGPLLSAAAEIVAEDDAVAVSRLLEPSDYGRLSPGVAQPLAGSFIEFVVASGGPDALMELYRVHGATPGPAIEAVEVVLGRSIDEIDTQWKDYLRAGTEPGADQAAEARP